MVATDLWSPHTRRYAHRLTTTYTMNELPPGWEDATPYDVRGWTTFEQSVSALNKSTGTLDTGGWRPLADPRTTRSAASLVPRSYRPPPLVPRAFAAKLATKLFTNGADCEVVGAATRHGNISARRAALPVDDSQSCPSFAAALYADTLAGTLGLAESLVYNFCEWGDDEMETLVKVLPMASRLKRLYLHGNPNIAERGLRALAVAIADPACAPGLRFISGLMTVQLIGELRAACAQRDITCDSVFPGSWYLGPPAEALHHVDEPDC